MSSGAESNDETSSEGWSHEQDASYPMPLRPTRARRGGRQIPATTTIPDLDTRLPWLINDAPQSNSLVVVQQPEAEFYKDQGGKGSHLTVSVRLADEELAKRWTAPLPGEGFEIGGPAPFPEPHITIPLEATLLYESGKKVDDTQILKITQNKPPALEMRFTGTEWCYEGEIHFRLEKVSLRNDGQRFKLQINAAKRADWISETHQKVVSHGLCDLPEHPQMLASWLQVINGCCTVPINVLSKRKAPAAAAAESTGTIRRGATTHRSTKRSRADSSSMGGIPMAPVDLAPITHQLSQMSQTLTRLMDMVERNTERLATLEDTIAQLPQSHHSSFRIPENAAMPSLTRLGSYDFMQSDLQESASQNLPLPLLTGRAPSWEVSASPAAHTATATSVMSASAPQQQGPPSLQPPMLTV